MCNFATWQIWLITKRSHWASGCTLSNWRRFLVEANMSSYLPDWSSRGRRKFALIYAKPCGKINIYIYICNTMYIIYSYCSVSWDSDLRRVWVIDLKNRNKNPTWAEALLAYQPAPTLTKPNQYHGQRIGFGCISVDAGWCAYCVSAYVSLIFSGSFQIVSYVNSIEKRCPAAESE